MFYLEKIIALPYLSVGAPKGIRPSLDICSENSNALNVINLFVDLEDFVLLQIAVQKLDKQTRQLLESKSWGTDYPTFQNLLNLLSDHWKALDSAQISDETNAKARYFANPTKPKSGLPQAKLYTTQINTYIYNIPTLCCTYCNESHAVYVPNMDASTCTKFSALPMARPKVAIQEERACYNCLSTGHVPISVPPSLHIRTVEKGIIQYSSMSYSQHGLHLIRYIFSSSGI